nr:ribonuclease H-like domain-containing protein [Tanacetum cinerariifolium]
ASIDEYNLWYKRLGHVNFKTMNKLVEGNLVRGKGTGHMESSPVWNNVQRINHHNKFAPTIVFIRSSRIPVRAAKPKATTSTSATKPVNTIGPKQSMNFSKSRSTFHKSHSPIRRSFYNTTTHSRRNSTERLNTTGSKAVSDVKGNKGHPQQALKNKGIVDSGFDPQNVVPSRDLTCLFAKASIDEYNLWYKRLGHVNFKTMNKLVEGNLVRGLPL